MDTRAYIESGIIESYVLGLAGAEESAELEMLCAQHADIRQAVDDFAALMEANAFENAVIPPPQVKDKVMLAISQDSTEQQSRPAPVVPMTVEDSESFGSAPSTIWRYLAAASIILFIASVALNLYFYNSYKDADGKYQALLTERNSLQASNDVFRTKLNGFEESMRIIQSPDVQKINLPGIKGYESSLAAVYWDSKTKDVYYLPERMAALPADKQYQLWAIVDGQPVSAGVIGDCDGLCKMTNIPRAQMFAITIEKKGGSDKPTLEAMVVAGEVKI